MAAGWLLGRGLQRGEGGFQPCLGDPRGCGTPTVSRDPWHCGTPGAEGLPALPGGSLALWDPRVPQDFEPCLPNPGAACGTPGSVGPPQPCLGHSWCCGTPSAVCETPKTAESLGTSEPLALQDPWVAQDPQTCPWDPWHCGTPGTVPAVGSCPGHPPTSLRGVWGTLPPQGGQCQPCPHFPEEPQQLQQHQCGDTHGLHGDQLP